LTQQQNRNKPLRKAKPASETHQSIDRQIEVFLKSGKEIQKIPRGASGPPKEKGARRHIRLGKGR